MKPKFTPVLEKCLLRRQPSESNEYYTNSSFYLENSFVKRIFCDLTRRLDESAIDNARAVILLLLLPLFSLLRFPRPPMSRTTTAAAWVAGVRQQIYGSNLFLESTHQKISVGPTDQAGRTSTTCSCRSKESRIFSLLSYSKTKTGVFIIGVAIVSFVP